MGHPWWAVGLCLVACGGTTERSASGSTSSGSGANGGSGGAGNAPNYGVSYPYDHLRLVDVERGGRTNVWAVGQGVYHFDGNEWSEVDVGVDATFFSVEAEDGGVWIGGGGILLERRGDDWVDIFPPTLDQHPINDIVSDSVGDLWVRTGNFSRTLSYQAFPQPQTLHRLRNGEWTEFEPVTAMTTDLRGTLYGYREALTRLDDGATLGTCENSTGSIQFVDSLAVGDSFAVALGGRLLCELDLTSAPEARGLATLIEPVSLRAVRVGETFYLLGETNMRRRPLTPLGEGGAGGAGTALDAWETLDWDFEIFDAAGQDDDAWFVGDFGIAHYDGASLEVVVDLRD